MDKRAIIAVSAAAGLAGVALFLYMRKVAAKITTSMVVTEEPPASLGLGESFTFSGHLEDAGGNVLPDKIVELYIDGSVVDSQATGALGDWGFSVMLEEGTHTICAKFSGDSEYLGCRRGGI